ncbi:ATP-binding protein [Halomonas ramblicola]|uniref:ATP-binding protein n=1 Tax=Halomonas ramblicola TaxID=747349 RepID=UPI0025B4F4EB|nr:ATP-binding protein [Halomonas ramblicola]MDN3522598.1 ATP-binding protein [Halomonas ramblicola]
MTSDARIADLRQRIQRWLHETPSGEGAGLGTIEGLDADIMALEAELRTLFQRDESTPDTFEALREQAVLRTVLESMVEGVIVADMAGHFLIFNTAARNLLGQGPVDQGPASWSEAYGLFRADGETPYPSEELPLSRSLRGEPVDRDELVIRTPERPADCHVAASGRPLWGEDGRQIGAVVVFHDITETKALERELRRARESAEETARVKSEFLANMSHEIRTPLTAVLGFTDLLLAPSLSDSDRLNYVQAVRRNGEHLLALINDVLDISKINADQVNVESVDFSLHQVLHEAASVMQVRAYEKGLAFDVAYETPIPARIESDPMRVRQILFNLLSNAVKFTQEGGVELTARCLDAGTDSSRVEVVVTDTGIGLSDAEIEGLFQPFRQANPSTTRQYGGTGLGLAICRSLAEALGGEVRVKSTPGEGSTFSLILYQPIDAQAEMVAEPGVSSIEFDVEPGQTGATRTLEGSILLAEDGIDNQLLLSTILRRQGLEVEIADNGQAAVTQAQAALDANAPFDLILMDMQMPRLDGYGATSRLRARGYTGPIVALTAHAMSGERERCLLAGCDDYLSKPIDRPLLLATVESYLKHDQVVGPEPTTTATLSGSDESGEGGGPLYSSFADDPDMEELVVGFVERLPLQVHDIRSAVDAGDLGLVRRLAHQLKGAAGGYGFMPVSRDAGALEVAAKHANQVSEVFDAMNCLAATCDRVRPGQQGTPHHE